MNNLLKRKLSSAITLLSGILSFTIALHYFADHPYGTPEGGYSDHFSHVSSAILFRAQGLEIYRKPVRTLLRQSHQEKDLIYAQSNQLGSDELFINPLDPSRRPLAINWSFQIRLYPLGVYLIFALVAMLFHFEKISFVWANRFILIFFILVAMAITLTVTQAALDDLQPKHLVPRCLTALLIGFWSNYWALNGFYDVLPLLLVLVSMLHLNRGKRLSAYCFFCFAIFLHFRALYYLPILIFALWNLRKEPSLFKKINFWMATTVGAVSLACLWIALPQLENFIGNNPLYHFYDHLFSIPSFVAQILSLFLLNFGIMLAARDWQSMLFLLSYLIFLSRTPQTYPWHSLFFLPLIFFLTRNLETRLLRLQWLVSVLLFFVLCAQVYHVTGL